MNRGFFGVAVFHPKAPLNVGSLWRTAHLLGAAFLVTIGRRYTHQPTDTLKSPRHVPLFNLCDFESFYAWLPHDTQLVGVEMAPGAVDLATFVHPHRACYLLGAEDHGLPPWALNKCHKLVQLRGERSLNVAVAGSIVLYHREGLK